MRPGRLLFIAVSLFMAYQLEAWLQPRSKPPTRAGATFEERLLSRTSYQVRRVMADVLWNRLDAYIHESEQVDPETGIGYSSYVGNNDVLALLSWVITLDPYFVEAHSTLASFHDGMGEEVKAIRTLERAIAQNPNDPYVVEFLGQLANIRIRRHELLNPISHLLDALQRLREGRGASETFTAAVLRGTLITVLYSEGRLLEARWAAMQGEHNLPDGHPALEAIGPLPMPAPAPAGASSAPAPLGEEHHAGDGHDHGPEPDIPTVRHDRHRRPWMEPHRMKDIRQRTWGAAVFFLLAFSWLLWRRRRRV